MSRRLSIPLSLCLGAGLLATTAIAAEERVSTAEDGTILIHPIATPDHLRNPWPDEQEATFRQRRSAFIKQYVGKSGVNTALENEKQGYPPSILAFCAGDREAAIAALQTEDAMAGNHAHTAGIDYYWSFTLKGQMRKYFFLGQYLDPAYRQRMTEGGAAWTATDPRPNTELVLLTDCPDPEVAAYAQATLTKMWRNKEQLLAMADQAEAEGHDNKKRFAAFIRGFADQVGDTPPADQAGWQAWWAQLCAGDWMVFEEYDRRTNLRPHPQYGIGTGPVGTDWSQKTRGGVVDWRNTDNLRGMREVAVYLMAEETGNDLVRRIFKERLRFTARNYLSIGNGEWDSPAYLSHTASAYLNLYDFAQDEEVRLLAKAILDYVTTSAAVKYFQGAFGGPNCRDYGTLSADSGPAAMIHFWAGPADETTHPENDIAHYATSAYRPPMAVVALARGEFPRPVELFANHPVYQTWLPGKDERPAYHETMYIANHYQMGSLVEGGAYDVNGGKILVEDPEGGPALFIIPSSQQKGNVCTNRDRNDRIAQHRNLQVFLTRPRGNRKNPDPAAEFSIFLPDHAAITVEEDGLVLVDLGTAYMALRGANTTFAGIDDKATGRFKSERKDKPFPGVILSGTGSGPGLAGFSIEMGEAESHGDFAAFSAKVRAANTIALADDRVDATAASGAMVGLQYPADGPVAIWRDGAPHDLATAHRGMWQNADGSAAPVSLGWKAGILTVEAGGHRFVGTMDRDAGTYSFTND